MITSTSLPDREQPAWRSLKQCEEAGVVPDQVFINCSGGGLTAGCAIAIHSQLPKTSIHPVEPEAYDDTCRSLESGRARAG